MAIDAVRSFSATTTTSFRKYIWIPILITLLKCVGSAEAHLGILLPSQRSSSTCPIPDPDLYYRPVIGIVSHPGDGVSGSVANSYIAASYVKFVESAGARVIPLIYTDPPKKLLKKLDLVNGVLFTGGWANSGLYFETIRTIFKKVLEKNDGGHHFPLYATCLGFELITRIVSEDDNILEEVSARNQASTLQFTENATIGGTVFERFPPGLLKKVTTDCIVMQNHHLGISPRRFLDNKKLSNFFEVLTTSKDVNEKDYVSTIRSWNYPVTSFQWHPEKNAFEWASRRIPHTEEAIQVTQYVANFLVSEARKSINRPPEQEVLDNLIYNHIPTYSGKAGRGFDQVYIFA